MRTIIIRNIPESLADHWSVKVCESFCANFLRIVMFFKAMFYRAELAKNQQGIHELNVQILEGFKKAEEHPEEYAYNDSGTLRSQELFGRAKDKVTPLPQTLVGA